MNPIVDQIRAHFKCLEKLAKQLDLDGNARRAFDGSLAQAEGCLTAVPTEKMTAGRRKDLLGHTEYGRQCLAAK